MLETIRSIKNTLKSTKKSNLSKMIEIGTLAFIEARSDWLTIEALYIAKKRGVEILGNGVI